MFDCPREILQLIGTVLGPLSVYILQNDLLGELYKPFLRWVERRHPCYTELRQPDTLEEAEQVLRFSTHNGHSRWLLATKLLTVPYFALYLQLIPLLEASSVQTAEERTTFLWLEAGILAFVLFCALWPLTENFAIRSGKYFTRHTADEIIAKARDYTVDYNQFEESLGKLPKRAQ